MTKKNKEQPPKLKVGSYSFGKSSISVREVESGTRRWQITDFDVKNLGDLAKGIELMLRDDDYYIIMLGEVKIGKSYSKEEIFETIANSISKKQLYKLLL